MSEHFDDCGMDGEQAACAARVRELWAAYEPLEREAHVLRGGIAWKTARGHDYLFRYFQDTVTAKKVFHSRGRRSSETEAEHAGYLCRRKRVHGLLARSAEGIETLGRVARAFRLARFPATPAAVVHGLWLEGCFDSRLRLMGATAVFGYELEGEFLAPAALVRGESLRILVEDGIDGRLADLAARLVTSADRAFSPVRRDQDHLVFEGGRGGRIELHSITALSEYLTERGLDRERVDVVMDALTLPAWSGLAVARDARMVPVRAVDPRAHALLTQATARTEQDPDRAGLLAKRAGLMSWASRVRLGLDFDDTQTGAFEDPVDEEDRASWPAWGRL